MSKLDWSVAFLALLSVGLICSGFLILSGNLSDGIWTGVINTVGVIYYSRKVAKYWRIEAN